MKSFNFFKFIMDKETILEAYEAPKCEIIEMQQEGVLCSSAGAEHDGYYEDEELDW